MSTRFVLRLPFTLNIPVEREELYAKFKDRLAELERIINDREIGVKTRLKALSLAIHLCRVLFSAVKDFEQEQIEKELAALRKEVERMKKETS